MHSMEFVNRKSERGFTLVELAIVMIIIGLLIGGILKGQELIANAQIAATVAQVKAIDGATTTFRDKYDALPGDMATAVTGATARLANCTGCTNGDGNGRLSSAPTAAPLVEGQNFFRMLSAADLIGGIKNDGSAGWGNIYPEAKIAGGFQPGYSNGVTFGLNGAPPAGHYLAIVQTAQTAPAGSALNPNEAFRIDTKLDDGVGSTGSVFANAVTNCATAGGIYDQDNAVEGCDIYIRFQN